MDDLKSLIILYEVLVESLQGTVSKLNLLDLRSSWQAGQIYFQVHQDQNKHD